MLKQPCFWHRPYLRHNINEQYNDEKNININNNDDDNNNKYINYVCPWTPLTRRLMH